MPSKHANQAAHKCMLFVRHDRYLAGTSMHRFKSIHVAKFTLAAASSVEKITFWSYLGSTKHKNNFITS